MVGKSDAVRRYLDESATGDAAVFGAKLNLQILID
jgi:hypothetical protein